MKVLILNPPVKDVKFTRDGRCQSEKNTWLENFPPVSLASIAGHVRVKYKTYLIDAIGSNLSFNNVMDKIIKLNPDYTVLDTTTPTIENDLNVAKAIKEKTNTKIILYGEHVTARAKEILKQNKFIDYIILGEAETPIMNIFDGKKKGDGIATKNSYGGVWFEPDLDKLAFPAYDLLPVYRYPLTGEKWMFMRTGRGCPYKCNYCVMPLIAGNKLRYHSPNYLINQMDWLKNNLGIKLFMFWDEGATFNKKRMLEICNKMIKTKLNKKVKWFCTTRVDRFDEELSKNMYEAGCRMISFGFESGNQSVLNKNNKGISIEQSIRAVRVAKKYHMNVIGHFIIGLPGSNDQTEKDTINLAKKLKINFAQFYTATPFPGSQFYKDAIKNKWIINQDWNKIEQGTTMVSYPDFPAERISYWRRRAYKEFYLRPYAVYSLLTTISLKKLFIMPFYITRFFEWANK